MVNWAFSTRNLTPLNSPLRLIDFYQLHMQAILISPRGLIARLLIAGGLIACLLIFSD